MKRHQIALFLFALLAQMFFSCEREAIACFEMTENGGLVSVDASCSANAKEYLWDFGDGATETGAVTKHGYHLANTYQVTLTITGRDGQSTTTTQEVKVRKYCVSCECVGPGGSSGGVDVWSYCGTRYYRDDLCARCPSGYYSCQCH